ncbi:MAG: class I SAM-dependent methyltransferase [Methylococcales bacterium]|jgi:cyclopropane fatty-acyl-phospholipid synthase-like methyltransferase
MSTGKTEVSEFFTMWAIYNKVLTNNYFHHNEIYQAVSTLLAERFEKQPFTLLDLGCGDAHFLTHALQGKVIKLYRGFDLSDPALILAAKNIGTLNCKSELINIDFMTGMRQTNTKFDIIFTSFALHHLTLKEKTEFFRLANNILTDNGLLLVIDLMREPNETLPMYLDNFCQMIRNTWLKLNEHELTACIQHVRNSDLPETKAILSSLAESMHFSPAVNLYHSHKLQFLLFNKKDTISKETSVCL